MRTYDTVDPEWLRSWLYSLCITPAMADDICGLRGGTIAEIISRRDRRDVNGMRSVETMTLRRIYLGLSTVQPILTVVVPDQGPRKVPSDIPVDMTTSPEDRIRDYHRQRKSRVTPSTS